MMEFKFWNCLHRLHNSIISKRVLPGAGATEVLCILKLEAAAANSDKRIGQSIEHTLSVYDGSIFRAVAECLSDLLCTTLQNSGVGIVQAIDQILQCKRAYTNALQERKPISLVIAPLSVIDNWNEITSTIYDDYLGKLAALKRAVQTVHLILQTDIVITNTN